MSQDNRERADAKLPARLSKYFKLQNKGNDFELTNNSNNPLSKEAVSTLTTLFSNKDLNLKNQTERNAQSNVKFTIPKAMLAMSMGLMNGVVNQLLNQMKQVNSPTSNAVKRLQNPFNIKPTKS